MPRCCARGLDRSLWPGCLTFMPEAFDPYQEWLGISPFEPPPNHYRLLGLKPFEDSVDVIERTVISLTTRLKTLAADQPESLTRRVFADIHAAQECLLNPQAKAGYDQQLREQQPSLSAIAINSASPSAAEHEAEAVLFAGHEEVASASSSATKLPAVNAASGKPAKARLIGDYVIVERIGVGGMGQVFKAQHRKSKRIVAIKVLPPQSIKSPDNVRRFYREVESAAKLNHPNIVRSFDAGEQNGIHFLVMEFVDGADLSVRLKQEGPLPLADVVEYMRQAAAGLEYAHAEGIVHRDIKPANLLLSIDGRIKLLDMGLAHNEDAIGNDGQRGLATTGQLMGTVDYMSPEQAEDTHQVDGRSDLYSLGCTMFRLLTNQLPYRGDTILKKVYAHRNQPIPSIRELRPDIPETIDIVFKRMIAKKPDDRYRSMAEFSRALQAAYDAGMAAPVARLAPSAPPTPLVAPVTAPRPAPVPSASGVKLPAAPVPARANGTPPPPAAVPNTPPIRREPPPPLPVNQPVENNSPNSAVLVLGIAALIVAATIIVLGVIRIFSGS